MIEGRSVATVRFGPIQANSVPTGQQQHYFCDVLLPLLHSVDSIDSDKSSPARLQSFGYGGDRHKLGSAWLYTGSVILTLSMSFLGSKNRHLPYIPSVNVQQGFPFLTTLDCICVYSSNGRPQTITHMDVPKTSCVEIRPRPTKPGMP